MYWVFFVFFIIGVLVPDIIRTDVGFFSEERVEGLIIFALGTIGFTLFLFKERQLFSEKKKLHEKEKKLDRTGKDLLKSYSYIGEVNRKMDMLMGLALGLYKNSKMSKKEEKDFYLSIAKAVRSLLKAGSCSLVFINTKRKKITKSVFLEKNKSLLDEKELSSLGGDINVKRNKKFITISSPNKMNGIRSYLVIDKHDVKEAANPKNLEILKFLASQALFLYSFMEKASK